MNSDETWLEQLLIDFAKDPEFKFNQFKHGDAGIEVAGALPPAVRRSNFLLRAFGKRNLF